MTPVVLASSPPDALGLQAGGSRNDDAAYSEGNFGKPGAGRRFGLSIGG